MTNQDVSSKIFSIKTLLQTSKQRTFEASQVLAYSLLLLTPTFIPSMRAPTGGVRVGGEGSINYNGLTTTVNQTSGSMAINWDSYNLNANERVQYNMHVWQSP